jgi:hypothetical protein
MIFGKSGKSSFITISISDCLAFVKNYCKFLLPFGFYAISFTQPIIFSILSFTFFFEAYSLFSSISNAIDVS